MSLPKKVKEPPEPRRGNKGIWRERLQPLVSKPRQWFLIFEADDLESAQAAADNLRRRNVMIPHPSHEWEFVARENEVYACYKGRGHASVRRAK